MTTPSPTLIRLAFARASSTNINGLTMHVLEAGFETQGRPCLLLLHGFPELAYSWRKVMLPLAAAGYHVDRAGPARLRPHHRLGRRLRRRSRPVPHAQPGARRARAGLRARLPLGRRRGRARFRLAGRGLVRAGPAGRLPLGRADERAVRRPAAAAVRHGEGARPSRAPRIPMHRELAALPRPRKHYSGTIRRARRNDDMRHAPQGVHAFLRAYYHHKSADWTGNKPFR